MSQTRLKISKKESHAIRELRLARHIKQREFAKLARVRISDLSKCERGQDEELQEVRDTLTNAVRETRKYNLGWMFISQTLSSLDRRIIEQLRMYFVGYGLAYGVELQGVHDLLRGNDSAIYMYQQFQDPKSSYIKSQYPFMCIGPSSPMSFSQVPLFLNSLDYPDEFHTVNKK